MQCVFGVQCYCNIFGFECYVIFGDGDFDYFVDMCDVEYCVDVFDCVIVCCDLERVVGIVMYGEYCFVGCQFDGLG